MTVLAFPVRRIADQELNLLHEVAVHPTGRRYPGVPALVKRCAAPDHTDETLRLAWIDFKESVRAVEVISADGHLCWNFFDPEECAGADHAIEMLNQRIDDAYRIIRNGPAGR